MELKRRKVPVENSPSCEVIRCLNNKTADKDICEKHAIEEATNIPNYMEKVEMISGQCEHCGTDYEMKLEKKAVRCPACKKGTDNWDTIGVSQMAPSIITISL